MRSITPQQIQQYEPMFGFRTTKALLADKAALDKGGIPALEIESASDMVKKAATESGVLPETGTPEAADKERFSMFQQKVKKRVTEFEGSTLKGVRKANNEELQKILDQMRIENIRVSEFGRDPYINFSIAKPEQLANSYVEYNGQDVKILPYIEKLQARKLPVTMQNIWDLIKITDQVTKKKAATK
jgi:hypothetical protein